MQRDRIPNLLTTLRLFMAAGFIALLSMYQYPDTASWALPVSAGVFIAAALTDALDGWLARRWNAVSLYGRIVDPAADKVLVLGAFVLLSSTSFADPAGGARPVSGVWAWMTAVILAREIITTSIRAVIEAQGVSFAAVWSGKLKMILQSAGVPAILIVVWLAEPADLADGWARGTVTAIAWAVTLITALTGLHYLYNGMIPMRKSDSGAA